MDRIEIVGKWSQIPCGNLPFMILDLKYTNSFEFVLRISLWAVEGGQCGLVIIWQIRVIFTRSVFVREGSGMLGNVFAQASPCSGRKESLNYYLHI
jgi:hypothetical protein